MTSSTFHRCADNQTDRVTCKYANLRGFSEDEFGVLHQALQRYCDINDLCFLLLLAGVRHKLSIPSIQDDQTLTVINTVSAKCFCVILFVQLYES